MLLTNHFSIITDTSVPALAAAGEQLKSYLSRIFGGSEPGEPITLSVDPALEAEEYRVIAGDNSLCIKGGTPRGVLYGVFGFLEDTLGCRFFSADTETIPSYTSFELADGCILTGKPSFEYRDMYWFSSFDPMFSVKRKINGFSGKRNESLKNLGGCVFYSSLAHSFGRLLLPDAKYFGEHPEYYGIGEDGKRHTAQPCLSNPEVLRLVVAECRRMLTENPDITVMSVTQNDNFGYCRCPECARIDAEEGSHAGSLLRFVNAVADALKEDFPNVLVDTFAYQYTRRAPALTKPRDNVIIRLCSIECCFSHPFDECGANGGSNGGDRGKGENSFYHDLEEWSKLAPKLYIWNYSTDYAHYQSIFPNLRTFAPDYRIFYRLGVRGIFDEGMYESVSGEFDELRSYIISKLMWDVNCDSDAAQREFLAAYYGAGWRHIAEYIDLICDYGEKVHLGISMYPLDIIPPETGFAARADALFDAAEREADSEAALSHIKRSRIQLRYYKSVAGMLDEKENRALYNDIKSFGITRLRERGSIKEVEDFTLSADKWR